MMDGEHPNETVNPLAGRQLQLAVAEERGAETARGHSVFDTTSSIDNEETSDADSAAADSAAAAAAAADDGHQIAVLARRVSAELALSPPNLHQATTYFALAPNSSLVTRLQFFAGSVLLDEPGAVN
jgi:hypothetical protein